MPKTIKSWLFIGFMTVMVVLLIWSHFFVRDRKMRMAQISQEHYVTAEEYKKINNRPIPDSIYMRPEAEIASGKRTYLGGIDEESKKRAKTNALKINKRDGVYYWDSNGSIPLEVVAEIKKTPNDFTRKVSTFTAVDGSGSIVIRHDGYVIKGDCHYPGSRAARYSEYRLNENREFHGWGYKTSYFPPRPDDWCKTFETRLNEEFN